MNPNILSIELISNQPFVFTANDPNCLGTDNRDYCVLVNECDQIQIQEKLLFDTTCFDNLLCDNYLGDEMVVNGDFATGDFTSWDTADVNWSVISGLACSTVAGTGTLAQTINPMPGNIYIVTFTISNYDTGNLFVDLGGTSLGSSPFTADGTYVEYVVAGAGTDIEFDADSLTACIDNISVKELICWDTPALTDWTLSPDSACHTVGSSVALVSSISIPSSSTDCVFELIITVSGMTTGSLTPSIGLDLFETITANGTYNLYVNSQGGADLQFTPSSGFDGCIGVPQLRMMCSYPTLGLFTIDDEFVLDLSIDGGVSIDIEGRYITWTFKLCQLEQVLSFGCYKFKLFDPCNDCFVNDNLLTNSTFETDLSGWSQTNFQWEAANGGQAGIASTGGAGQIDQVISSFSGAQNRICVRFTVRSISGSNTTVGLAIRNSVSGVTNVSLSVTTTGVYSLSGIGDWVYFSVIGVAPLDAAIDDVYVILSEEGQPCDPYCYQLESNCLNWRESHECTKLFIAYCEENSLGFNFGSTVYVGTGFKLQERFRVANFNPSHNKVRNIQLDSGGAKKLIFAQNEKQYQMRFDYIDQRGHDVIAAMMDCDVIQINHGEINAYPTPYDETKEYVCLTENYEPEWEERGARNLAQSEIEITEVPSTIFNQNLT